MTVIGFGDPVLDLISHVPFDVLRSLDMEPGGCSSVSATEMETLLNLPAIKLGLTRHPGGSAANVCKALAGLAPDRPIHFIGMIGDDAAGREYAHGLSRCGVVPELLVSTSGAASATCLCLVTPDGQRTMRTFLGAALELNAPAQLPSLLTDSGGSAQPLRLLHCEGYCLYRPAVSAAAMRAARAAGATVLSRSRQLRSGEGVLGDAGRLFEGGIGGHCVLQ